MFFSEFHPQNGRALSPHPVQRFVAVTSGCDYHLDKPILMDWNGNDTFHHMRCRMATRSTSQKKIFLSRMSLFLHIGPRICPVSGVRRLQSLVSPLHPSLTRPRPWSKQGHHPPIRICWRNGGHGDRRFLLCSFVDPSFSSSALGIAARK